ncbi:DUF1173 family protein [Nocardia sp. NPDC004068]|uniref:DUF1173 family protein n=1 Tax=Nocardia sp. NPDC004068 TaxID=3364303 RepID=UPI0036D00F31
MRTQYALGGHILDPHDARFHDALALAHRDRERPECLCAPSETGGVPMYIARIRDRFHVKRMPGTGPDHAPDCPSWCPPPEVSGLSAVLGTAVCDQPDLGTTRLGLGFALTRRGTRAPDGASSSDTAPDTGSQLSLRGLLHYLWDEAGLTRWTPVLAGKRHWGVVRARLLDAAETKSAKGHPLTDLLYIPETFSSTRKSEIAARRATALARLTGRDGQRKLMLLIGEVKAIRPTRFGRSAVIIKHLPDFPLLLDRDLHAHLERTFATELQLRQALSDSHLILLATFTLSQVGLALADAAAMMTVTRDWIPFETVTEYALIGALTAQRRRFVKSLRYMLAHTAPIATAVLADTTPPTACYITDTHHPAPDSSPLTPWIWNTTTAVNVPPLPAAEAPDAVVDTTQPRG